MSEVPSQLSAALADRYRIERQLGEGGMATVYLAEDLKHKRKVAVKVLRPELAAVLGAERFLQEITTTASLQHPNILPLFDSGTAGQRDGGTAFLYYVMPYIEGETLRAKLDRETQLSVEEAVRIATEAANALDYAHRQGVIHRDIKPENILLHDGRPIVADFGIALAVSAAAGGRMTETGLSLGTPHYMSPEQATAEKDITNRSDIYSLGSVLYEMLTGQPPHSGGSAQQIIMKIVTEEAAPVTKMRRAVPPHVAAATAKSLEKLAADRFESAAKFAEALANPAFTTSTFEGTSGRAPARVARMRIASAVAVLSVGLLAGYFLGSRGGASGTVSGAQRQRIVLGERAWDAGDLRFGAAVAPDGSAIVYVDSVAQGWGLFLKPRDAAEGVPLAGTTGGFSPFFSPDGESIGFFVSGGGVRRVPVGGGASLSVSDSDGFAGAWLDDGTIVFARSNGSRLMRVPASGGSTETLLLADSVGMAILGTSPLPGGDAVLVFLASLGASNHEIGTLDLRTGSLTPLIDGAVSATYVHAGYLVFVRADGTVFAQEFDAKARTLRGSVIFLTDGVATVSGGSFADFKVGASGTALYLKGAGSGGLFGAFFVDRNGASTPVDSTVRFERGLTPGLSVSPDGRHLALDARMPGGAGGTDIYVKELPDGPAIRLSAEGRIDTRPVWTPDGRSVVWVSAGGGEADLWIQRADGSRPAELLLHRKRGVWEGQWSPDGQWLVFRTDEAQAGNGDILAVRPGDSAAVELLATEFSESSPNISPDGRWLAYVSNETGAREVYVRPFPDVGESRVRVSTDGGTEPLWSHSGRELFYRNGNGDLVSATVTTTPSFVVRHREVLFPDAGDIQSDNAHMFAVLPDDQRFIVVRPAAFGGTATRGDLVLVENWMEEVKARGGS